MSPLLKLATMEFATEGPALFIGSSTCARHWKGREPDEAGVEISYWGVGLETLPKELALTTKKGGARKRTFSKIADAAEFETRLLARLMQLHPRAARPAKYPDYPTWYVDEARVFGMERQFSSALGSVLKKLKGDTANVVFDKPHRARALFLATDAGARGLIATGRDAIAVTRIFTSEKDVAEKEMVQALERTQLAALLPDGELTLTDDAVIFDAALSSAAIAAHNWKTLDIATGVATALQATTSGPLRVPDQKLAGGAFLRTKPGAHHYAMTRDARGNGLSFDVLWIWPA